MTTRKDSENPGRGAASSPWPRASPRPPACSDPGSSIGTSNKRERFGPALNVNGVISAASLPSILPH